MGGSNSVVEKPVAKYKTKKQNIDGIPKILSEPYIMNESSIGEGRFGYVRSGVDTKCERRIAVKCVLKKYTQETETLYNEKRILEKLYHPNIVKYYDFFTTPTETCLVIEKCEGGELFDLIEKENKPLTEKRACAYMVQILDALSYLHSKNIAHRDLKLENCMFKDKEMNQIKIIDFGMAKEIKEPISGIVGTVSYMSPDILNGYYTCKTDMWSVGVMLFVMVSGEFPFEGDTPNEVYDEIKNTRYSMDSPAWSKISFSCKGLIKRLLDPNPTTRISAKDALKHPWVLNTLKMDRYLPWRTVLYGMDKYIRYNTFKQVVLQRMTHYLEGSFIEKINNTYDLITTKQDETNLLTAESFSTLCTTQGETIPIERIDHALQFIEQSLKQPITRDLFAASCLRRTDYMKDVLLYKAFYEMDEDQDGKLNHEDLIKVFQEEEIVQQILNDARLISSQLLLNYDSLNAISYNLYKRLIGTRTFKDPCSGSPHQVLSSVVSSQSMPSMTQPLSSVNSLTDMKLSISDIGRYNFTSPAIEACLNTPTPTEDDEDEIVFM